MRRIVDPSKALSGGSSWRIDSSVRGEFGWGSHTAHAAIVTYEHIHSHATVYVSEQQILIVLSSDPDQGSIYVETRTEDKYAIDLTDVTDVVIKRDPSIGAKTQKRLHKDNKESRKQSVFVYLRSFEVVIIDTYDSDHTAKTILAAWHSNMARKSARLGPPLGSEDRDVGSAFYDETVLCLQSATTHAEVLDILEDFSKEVLSDLELKDAALRSRELVMVCLHMVQDLLTCKATLKVERGGRHTEILPVAGNKHILAERVLKSQQTHVTASGPSGAGSGSGGGGGGAGSGSAGLDTARTVESQESRFHYFNGLPGPDGVVAETSGGGNKNNGGGSAAAAVAARINTPRDPHMTAEMENKLKTVAVQRLHIVRAILKLFSTLLFGSECIPSRFALLLGPTPFDIPGWMKLLVPDLYKVICASLGCSDESTASEIEAEIELSVQVDRQNRSRSNTYTSNDGDGGGSDTGSVTSTTMSTPRKYVSGTPRIADAMLTPSSARARKHSLAFAAAAADSFHLNNSGNNLNNFGDGGGGSGRIVAAEVEAAMDELEPLRKSVRDMQGMLLLEIYRTFGLAKAMVKGHNSQEQQAQLSVIVGPSMAAGLMKIKTVSSVSDFLIREASWEDAIEDIVTRVSSLLEDLSTSTRAINESNTTKKTSTSSKSKKNNSSSASNVRQSNSMSTSSLQMMVPPSPRSPPSSARSLKASALGGLTSAAVGANSSSNINISSSSNSSSNLNGSSAGRLALPRPHRTTSPSPRGGVVAVAASPRHSSSNNNNSSSSGSYNENNNNHSSSSLLLPPRAKSPSSALGSTIGLSPRRGGGGFFESIEAATGGGGGGSKPASPRILHAGDHNASIKAPFIKRGQSPVAGAASSTSRKLDLRGIAAFSGIHNSDGDPAEAREQLGRFATKTLVTPSPLRTQEILLFYLTALLNTMAMDSYKIRESMVSELGSYWRSVIGLLNVLCPRPMEVGEFELPVLVHQRNQQQPPPRKRMNNNNNGDSTNKNIHQTPTRPRRDRTSHQSRPSPYTNRSSTANRNNSIHGAGDNDDDNNDGWPDDEYYEPSSNSSHSSSSIANNDTYRTDRSGHTASNYVKKFFGMVFSASAATPSTTLKSQQRRGEHRDRHRQHRHHTPVSKSAPSILSPPRPAAGLQQSRSPIQDVGFSEDYDSDEADDLEYHRYSYAIDRTEDLKAEGAAVFYTFDYGPPRYGLSYASWLLVVLARKAVEAVILRLNLDPRIITHRVPGKNYHYGYGNDGFNDEDASGGDGTTRGQPLLGLSSSSQWLRRPSAGIQEEEANSEDSGSMYEVDELLPLESSAGRLQRMGSNDSFQLVLPSEGGGSSGQEETTGGVKVPKLNMGIAGAEDSKSSNSNTRNNNNNNNSSSSSSKHLPRGRRPLEEEVAEVKAGVSASASAAAAAEKEDGEEDEEEIVVTRWGKQSDTLTAGSPSATANHTSGTIVVDNDENQRIESNTTAAAELIRRS